MEKIAVLSLMFMFNASTLFSASITDNLTDPGWTFGIAKPEIVNGTRGDNTTGPYHHLPIGTSGYYWATGDSFGGEGSVTFWIFDPGHCISDTTTMFGTGPSWGLQTLNNYWAVAGIYRIGSGISFSGTYDSKGCGCNGYKIWSNITPNEVYWFKDGIRNTYNVSWNPGWYKWKVMGQWNEISWTLFNVTYYQCCYGCYCGDSIWITGDYTKTVDASNHWSSLFGIGYSAFYLTGDSPNGFEDISVEVVAGDGVFANIVTNDPITKPHQNSTWGNIKALFR